MFVGNNVNISGEVSISTIEHVGFDEEKYLGNYHITPYPTEKILRVINNLKRHLSAHGKLIITAPLGYNPDLDEQLRNGQIFTDIDYLKRISRTNKWIETGRTATRHAKHNAPFRGANRLAICLFEQSI